MQNKRYTGLAVSLATAVFLGFTGCGGGGGGGGSTATATTGSSGGGSKGPFKQGSLVIAYKLDANGSRDVNTTTVTTDSKGHFSFSSLPWSGATEFVMSGEYLNENTGTYMELPSSKGLSAIANIATGTSPTININVLTDIAAAKIKADMANGSSITQAKESAKENVAKLFNIDLSSGTNLTDLDLTDGSGTNAKANTQLLLVSSALLKTTNPEQVMEQLKSDMADGTVDSEAVAALDEVKTQIAKVDLVKVATNMEDADIGVTDAPSETSVLDGTLSLDNNISFTPTVDAYRDTAYTSNDATINGIIGGSGPISITGGSYSIDAAPFVTTAGTVANGQVVRVKVNSSANYSETTEATVTIGGADFTYSVTTKADPFVADATPNPFDFGYKANQTPNATNITSNPVAITGINTPVSVTIDNNGTFDVNSSGNFVTSATITNNSTIRVRNNAGAAGSQVTSTVTIGGVSGTFNIFATPEDTTPYAVTVKDVKDVNQSATPTVTSEAITITGINVAVPISIEGGKYAIGTGAFTDVSGTITDGKTVKIKVTPSSNYETTTTATLKVGNMLIPFHVTTMSDPFVADTTPNSFDFTTLVNQAVSTTVEQNITVSGINTPTSVSIINGTYVVNGGTQDANVSNGDVVTVTQTTADIYATEKVTTLTIGGVSANFKTITMTEDTTPDDFSFDANLSVPLATKILSESVTISGLTPNTTLPVSIENGEYSLNGGSTWTATAAIVQNGDTIIVRQLSATTQGTLKVTTLTVGSLIRSFTTKTVVNPPLLETASLPTTTAEDSEFVFEPTLGTNSGEVATWSIANKPTWATFNELNGRLSGIPRNGDVGTYADINITASNPQGSASVVFDLNVTNTNDAPTAEDANATIAEDTVATIDVNSSITDVDVGDSYTVTVSQPTFGSADVNGTVITYTPNANFNGADSFTYTATDAAGATATATINVSVTPVDDITLIGGTTTATINEDTTNPVSASVTVTDVDANATISAKTATGNYGTFIIAADGSWNYTVDNNNSSVQALAQGETLNDVMSIVTTDAEATADLNVTINGVNDAPVLSPANITTASIKKQTDLNIALVATDVDNGAVVTLSSATASGATVNFDANGSVVFNASAAGNYTLNYIFSDEYNATANGSIIVTVTNSDAPVAGNDTFTTDEDTNATINILANDSDDFTADANLTVTIETQPAHGSVVVGADNNITYAPALNYNGTDGFTYKITDEDGGFTTADVNITINPVNDAPVAVDDNVSALFNQTETFNILANDSDVDSNISIASCDTNATQGGTVNILDTTAGTVSYTSAQDYTGLDTFTCTITDGDLNATETINVNVSGNHAPTIQAPVMLTMTLGESLSGQMIASDVDVNDTLTFNVSSLDSNILQGSSLDANGTYTIVASAVGTGAIDITVTDDGNPVQSATTYVEVTVIYPKNIDDSYNTWIDTNQSVYDAATALQMPTDTKLYSVDGVNTENNVTVMNTWWLEFMADGTFMDSESNGTWSADGNNVVTVSMNGNSVAEAKMLDLNMSATEIANEIPSIADLVMPADAVVSKIALHMLQEEYDLWEEAGDWVNNSITTYASLQDMMDTPFATVGHNRYNNNRRLVFALDQNLSSGSGVVMEVDMTDVWENNASEPTVVNPNAGTWSSATPYVDDNDANNTMVMVQLNDGLTSYDKNIILVDAGAVVNGNTTTAVYRGEYRPAGYSVEYYFNDVAMSVIQNAFAPVTFDEYKTNVIDANTTELNTTTFSDLTGLSADLVGLSPFYAVDGWQEQNNTITVEAEEYVFDSNGTVVSTVYKNGVQTGTETLGYSVDSNNTVTLTIATASGDLPVHQFKVLEELNATASMALTGMQLPQNAVMYKNAYVDLIDADPYFIEPAVAYEANSADSNFTSLNDFITAAQPQNGKIFYDIADQNGSNFGLAFEDNATGSSVGDSGSLTIINLDDNTTSYGGTWEIESMFDENNDPIDVLVINPSNPEMLRNICFAVVGGVVQVGELGMKAGVGHIGYMLGKKAYDIIDANFQNQMLLQFTYIELADKIFTATDVNDNSTYTITFGSYYDPRITITDSFNSEIENSNFSIIDGKLMLNSGCIITRIENYGTYSIVTYDMDGDGNIDKTLRLEQAPSVIQ